MNRFAIVTTLLIFIQADSTKVVSAGPGDRERTFVRALELFDTAQTPDDYRESARLLESIVEDGFRSGAVYYNLGNAYFRAGDFGRAILNYRKAKPYRPRDQYLSANLEHTLSVAPGRLSEETAPWWTHVLFWTDWISYPMKVRLCFLGLSLAAVSTAIVYVWRISNFSIPIMLLILITTAFGVDLALRYGEINDTRRAVITGETVARKGIGNSYEPAFDQPLRDGAEFQILSETSDWVFGHFGSIGDGWVRKEFVAR